MKQRTAWPRSTWQVAALPVALLAMQAALGQPPPGAPRGGPPPIERLAQELNLDAAQKAEVQRILEEQRAKHETERKQYAATGQRPTPEEMQTLIGVDDVTKIENLLDLQESSPVGGRHPDLALLLPPLDRLRADIEEPGHPLA